MVRIAIAPFCFDVRYFFSIGQCMPGADDYLASARIEGKKPGGADCCAPSCCE